MKKITPSANEKAARSAEHPRRKDEPVKVVQPEMPKHTPIKNLGTMESKTSKKC